MLRSYYSRAITPSQHELYLSSFQHPRAFAVSQWPVISAKDLQQFCGLVRDLVHQGFSIPLHVALCLIKRQFPNVAQSFFIVLWKEAASKITV